MRKVFSVFFAVFLMLAAVASASGQASDCGSAGGMIDCEGAGTGVFNDDGSMGMTLVMNVGDPDVVSVSSSDLGISILLDQFEEGGLFTSEGEITEDVEDEFAFVETLNGDYRVFEGTSDTFERGQDAQFVIVVVEDEAYFFFLIGTDNDVTFPWIEDVVTEDDVTIVPEGHIAIPLDE